MWNMGVLTDKLLSESLLLNFDGLRPGGPAGGLPHRLMDAQSPDAHGPYIAYYQSWFGAKNMVKAADFGSSRVCFKEIYFPPVPGVAWFWNDWGIVNKCSTVAASPLYQSFNIYLRKKWMETFGATYPLIQPDTDRVHIIIEVRKIDKRKGNNHSSARHIANLKDLIAALETLPGVRVTAQNFAELPFGEQVALSHSAGVFLSMHGAGTTHIFHSAVGSPNCCALVEMFPDATIEFQAAFGYGNLARMFGLHHWRYEASMGRTKAEGTTVDVEEMKALTAKAVEAVRTKPTCLFDVKDTTKLMSA